MQRLKEKRKKKTMAEETEVNVKSNKSEFKAIHGTYGSTRLSAEEKFKRFCFGSK